MDMDDDLPCIVGMACRLPGGIYSSSDLWEFLMKRKSAQCEVPPDRFNVHGFYHPDGKRAGVMNVSGGYFLQDDVRNFDNSFFGINNLEATYMDPQQRKLLEVVYECFENAGVTLEDISGTNIGVYVANFTTDYQRIQTRDPDYLHRYNASGSGTTIMANRISHVFNLQGPSLTLDTACSSSIYCLHAAVSALKIGDCNSAIVAGANLITTPEQHLGTMKSGVLSPSSTCHTFDTAADGYGRADGVGAIYVKRLSQAMRDGDKIWAVVRGTAINSNGTTPGITQPSSDRQEAVIRKAYSSASLDFAETDYVECHGTGTAVGDVVEVAALGRCFAREGPPLMIGSNKTQLGHSEAASGLTSIIKVALAFEHRKIPPTCGVVRLNPKLQLGSLNMKVLTEEEPWPRAVQRASINSFGYGGANAHAILESPTHYISNVSRNGYRDLRANGRIFLLLISAESTKSLERRKMQIREYIQRSTTETIERLAFTLAQRRTHMRIRSFLPLSIKENTSLDFSGIEPTEPVTVERRNLPPFAFVFTGQGAQYAEMAKELLLQNDTFSKTIRQSDNTLQNLPEAYRPCWTLKETILDPPETSQIDEVIRSQPLCTALQIALVNILREWGITPEAVVGHSSGEIAAAYAHGSLSADQAIIISYFRGYAVSQSRSRGAMMAAGLDVASATDLIHIKGLGSQVCVACVNASDSVTLSGSPGGIDDLEKELQNQKKFTRKLRTGQRAYHSYMMKEIGPLYESLIATYLEASQVVRPKNAKMYSSVGHSGEKLIEVSCETNMSTYWRDNLEKPVQFSSALSNMLTNRSFHLIEIGPHSALKGPIQQAQAKRSLHADNISHYSCTLVRDGDSNMCMKRLAGLLYMHGYNLNWKDINSNSGVKLEPLTDVPPYPWDYSSGLLWQESRASTDLRNRQHIRHELLGSQQLTGNGVDWNWRNIVILSEVPWMRDHKVESNIVFPAAAYLALAMEALSQIQGMKPILVGHGSGKYMFELRNVAISTALVLYDDEDSRSRETEVHTSMSPRRLSGTTVSDEWYEFSVSSWASGQGTTHCTGAVRLVESVQAKGTVMVDNTNFDVWSMSRWYQKLRAKGLGFGLEFQSLSSLHTDSYRTRTDALATTLLQAGRSSTYYAMHPISIDACLQAAIMGDTAGNLSSLRAWLPISIEQCRIMVTDPSSSDCEAWIHTRSDTTGASFKRIDSTLRDSDRVPVIDLKGVRMSLYTGIDTALQTTETQLRRHPCIRILWKPDIFLSEGRQSCLQEYLAAHIESQELKEERNEDLEIVGILLDLAAHKNPRLRILGLGNEQGNTDHWKEVLGMQTEFPRCLSWSTGTLSESGHVSVDGIEEVPFGMIVISRTINTESHWDHLADELSELCDKNYSWIITPKTSATTAALGLKGFTVLEAGRETILAIKKSEECMAGGHDLLILVRQPSAALLEFAHMIMDYFKRTSDFHETNMLALSEVTPVHLSKQTICVSLLEMDHEFLASMNQEDMDALRTITNMVTSLLWLTAGNARAEWNPSLALARGLSRALRLEQPSLMFSILDIQPAGHWEADMVTICESIAKIVIARHRIGDYEFIQTNGLLHVSRFYPDTHANKLFRRRLGVYESQEQVRSLNTIRSARLAIRQIGESDTMHFQEFHEPPVSLAPGFLDVAVKVVSLNAKDVYTMNGRSEGTLAMEFSGIVMAVGSETTHLRPGDRVAVWAPNRFGTVERVPEWAVHKLSEDEDLVIVPTLLTAYASALYALQDRANLQPGESILVHSGTGGLGLASISIAQRLGATVYTTVSSATKKDFLVKEMKLPSSHIFHSRDSSFASGVKSITNGKGVDVVLNSLVGDLMHASWDCLADFGRFVEVGRRELVDAGKLDMSIFLRNATFTAFDLTELYFSKKQLHRNTLVSKMRQVLKMYRSGQITPPPIKKFDVADITKAYRYFSTGDRIGKVVISLEDGDSRIPVSPSKYLTVFSAKKIYILVGCLGGLGRSLSLWMLSRGARNFVFLARSGCDKPSSQLLIQRLQTAGAQVSVVRGDVSIASDVARVFAACVGKPIGGVVQAAMGLHEALFSVMSNAAWHTAVSPKWAGTWHLHHALEGNDDALDFFMMTSSVAGTIGTATESNYCAANSFLDAFAHWRRQQGKPAVSIGLGMISEVGYLHENPDIEALLLRKGIQPLNEEEFLQIVDLALSGTGVTAPSMSVPAASHLLTGLEPSELQKMIAKGFEVSHSALQDPRAAILSATLESVKTKHAMHDEKGFPHILASAAPWFSHLPTGLLKVFAAACDAPSFTTAITQIIRKRLSNLILMPMDQIDDQKPLLRYGMDSMIAAEFRTWFWTTFRVDIPFLDILNPNKSVATLSDSVREKLMVENESLQG